MGIIGTPLPGGSATPTIQDYAVLEGGGRGDVFLVRDAPRELGLGPRGDQLIIEAGHRSLLAVPLRFGEQVGGGLFFVTRRERWYDEGDVEVAAALAAALALAIQHQRLAEHQQRLGAAEAKAQKLERQVAALRTALDDRIGVDAVIGRGTNFLAGLDDARQVGPPRTAGLLTRQNGTGQG